MCLHTSSDWNDMTISIVKQCAECKITFRQSNYACIPYESLLGMSVYRAMSLPRAQLLGRD